MSFKWLSRTTSSPGPYLTLVRSEADYLKALKALKTKPLDSWIKTPHADATYHSFDHPDGERCAIVAIRVKDTSTALEICGLLVHEAVHITQNYFAHIGEHTPGTEQQAYAVQAIAQALMTEYARQIGEDK